MKQGEEQVVFQDRTVDEYIEEAKKGMVEIQEVVGTNEPSGGEEVVALPPLPRLTVDIAAANTEIIPAPLNSLGRMRNGVRDRLSQGMGHLRNIVALATTPRGSNNQDVTEEADNDAPRRSRRISGLSVPK